MNPFVLFGGPRGRSLWLAAALVYGLAGLAAFAQPTNRVSVPVNTNAPAPRRPNLVFILADDLGYGDLGCYGQTKIKTPNLDQLAAGGMRFTDFYAGSTVCAPSRAALMLGRHTGHLRIRGNRSGATLGAEELTIAEVLQRSGYHTGLIGKWGLSEPGLAGVPQKKGYDEFVGYLENVHAHDYYTTYLWRYDPATKYDGKVEFPNNNMGRHGTYIPDLCTKAALNFLNNNKPDRFNRYRPLFLSLNYTIPHANNEEGRRTGNGLQVPNDGAYRGESWPQVEKNKAAMITRMDTDVGQLVDRLKALKIEEDTIVIFTSDNGPHQEGGVDPKFFASAGPYRGHKRDLTEGGIRVPLIVRWPSRVAAGTVSHQPFAFWDLFPTLAEIARQKPVAGLDGISMLPTLRGQKQTEQHEYLYWEFHEGGFQQAVRLGNWKGIRAGVDGKLALYDLAGDPGEKSDAAGQHPDVVAKIKALMKSARTEDPQWPARSAAETKKTQDAK